MIKSLYRHVIRPFLSPMEQQRLKLFFLAWAYLPLLTLNWLPRRWSLLWAFLRIDWNIQHGHRPVEITAIARAFYDAPSGVMIEAGCWKGGSTAKFSLLCQRFQRRLYVYDSFMGVGEKSEGYDFTGEYVSSLQATSQNVERYGDISQVVFTPGWFSETLALDPPHPIAIAFIDCDVPNGSIDALRGIVAAKADGVVIFTQDYHIPVVRRVLNDSQTWQTLGCPTPKITQLAHNTARIVF